MNTQSNIQGVIEVFGVYFCRNCKNIMTPTISSGPELQFECVNCGFFNVDFSKKTGMECALFSKDLRPLRKNQIADRAFIFDPTFPSIHIECPECGYGKAICFLRADEAETKMVAKLMCRNVKGNVVICGHAWTLNDESEIAEVAVRIKREEEDDDFDSGDEKMVPEKRKWLLFCLFWRIFRIII